jgi:hypothetical protein
VGLVRRVVMPEFEIQAEWEEAPGVASPVLAATWARISIRADNKAVTQFLSLPGVWFSY